MTVQFWEWAIVTLSFDFLWKQFFLILIDSSSSVIYWFEVLFYMYIYGHLFCYDLLLMANWGFLWIQFSFLHLFSFVESFLNVYDVMKIWTVCVKTLFIWIIILQLILISFIVCMHIFLHFLLSTETYCLQIYTL